MAAMMTKTRVASELTDLMAQSFKSRDASRDAAVRIRTRSNENPDWRALDGFAPVPTLILAGVSISLCPADLRHCRTSQSDQRLFGQALTSPRIRLGSPSVFFEKTRYRRH